MYLSEKSDDTLTRTFNEGFFPTLPAHNVLGKRAVSVHDLIASPPPTQYHLVLILLTFYRPDKPATTGAHTKH